MILGECLGSVDLSRAQALCIYEATKIVIVCKDEHFVIATFKIVMSYLEDFDNN